MAKLTNAQVFTLRRIKNGESAQISTQPIISGRWFILARNCPSLPKLYKLGFVERAGFSTLREVENGLFHRVKLTDKGEQALIDYAGVNP